MRKRIKAASQAFAWNVVAEIGLNVVLGAIPTLPPLAITIWGLLTEQDLHLLMFVLGASCLSAVFGWAGLYLLRKEQLSQAGNVARLREGVEMLFSGQRRHIFNQWWEDNKDQPPPKD